MSGQGTQMYGCIAPRTALQAAKTKWATRTDVSNAYWDPANNVYCSVYTYAHSRR